MHELQFRKQDRLCNKTLIDRLFSSDDVLFYYPVKVVFRIVDQEESKSEDGVQVLISVSKRNHKRAVVRNLLKRRVREAYRLNKQILIVGQTHLNIAIIYSSKSVEPYQKIEDGVKKALSKINSIVAKSGNCSVVGSDLGV